MIKIKAGKRKAVASALTFCFFLQQSFCLQVMATSISGVTGNNGVYDITPTAKNPAGDIGFRKYQNFDLSQGDIANLIFHLQGQDLSTFVNLVDNQINIQGIVNAVNKNGEFNNGHAVFISPNGMVVGSSGVLNVGSLSVMTPDNESYEKFKSDLRRPSLIADYKSQLGEGTASVKIDGSVLARNFVDINAADVNIAQNALIMAGVKDATKIISNKQAEALFNKLVNTDNMSANSFANNNGSILIKSYGANGGTDIAGTMNNFGTGSVEVTNLGSKGINVSGKSLNSNGDTLLVNQNGEVNVSGTVANKGGKLLVDNTGDGVLIASTGLLSNQDGELIVTNTGDNGVNIANGGLVNNSTHSANIINSGKKGINVKGHVNANGINITNKNSNVVLGDSTGNNNLNSTANVSIQINDGNLLNYGTKETLIKASKDLNIDVKNGAIGKEVGPCDGGVCTGIGTDGRDLTKSVNVNVDGNVKAISTKGTNESLINMASLNNNMNVDQIKADGRVILLADSSVKGSKAYDIINASTNSKNPNVEGTGISIISSGNIGSKDKALTFRQNGVEHIFYGDDATKPHVVTDINKPKQGIDLLAINDINVKGMDAANGTKLDTNACAIISRNGNVNAEFSGDVYVRETTAKNVNLTTRGKNMYIENLGEVPTYSQDYYGPNGVKLEKAKLVALDLGSYKDPNEAPEYEHAADSTIVVKNGTIYGKGQGRPAKEQDLTMVADNAYAGGYYFNMGKHRPDGKSTLTVDGTTNPLKNGTDPSEPVSIRTKAVRPEDVTAIGEDKNDRNYYYGGSSQGDDPNYDGVKDPNKQGSDEDDDNLVVPEDKNEPIDTDNDTDTDIDTDTDTDTDLDTDTDTDIDTDIDTDTDTDTDIDTDTDTDIDTDTDTDTDIDTDSDTDTDIDTDTDTDTDLDSDTDTDTDTDIDSDTDTDTDIDTDTDTDIDTDTDSDIDTDTDTDTDTDIDTDLDTDTDTDTDTDIDSDTDTDTDIDTDTDTDIDTDTDTDTDSDIDSDTDTDADTDTDIDTDLDTDTDTDTDSDIDSDTDTDIDIDTDTDTDVDTDTDTDTDVDPDPDPEPNPKPNIPDRSTDYGKGIYKQRVVEYNVNSIDKRHYMRFPAQDNRNPVQLADNAKIDSLLDISRGGIAVTHHNDLRVGDVVPVNISYGNLNINADVKIVSATDRRAGAEFTNLDQMTANKLLYMNLLLEEQAAMRNQSNDLSYIK